MERGTYIPAVDSKGNIDPSRSMTSIGPSKNAEQTNGRDYTKDAKELTLINNDLDALNISSDTDKMHEWRRLLLQALETKRHSVDTEEENLCEPMHELALRAFAYIEEYENNPDLTKKNIEIRNKASAAFRALSERYLQPNTVTSSQAKRSMGKTVDALKTINSFASCGLSLESSMGVGNKTLEILGIDYTIVMIIELYERNQKTIDENIESDETLAQISQDKRKVLPIVGKLMRLREFYSREHIGYDISREDLEKFKEAEKEIEKRT